MTIELDDNFVGIINSSKKLDIYRPNCHWVQWRVHRVQWHELCIISYTFLYLVIMRMTKIQRIRLFC